MLSFALLIAVGVISYIAYKILFPSHSKDLPPMPCRPVPFFGHILHLISEPPTFAYSRWRKKVGDIYSIYVGSKLYIMVSNFDLLKEIFAKRWENFSDRAEVYAIAVTAEPKLGVRGLLGKPWKDNRVVSAAIFRTFGLGKDVMADRITEEVDMFVDELASLKEKPIDFHLLMDNAVSNITIAILLGHRFDYGDPEYTRIVQLLRDQMDAMRKAAVLDVFEWLKYIPFDPFYGKRVQDYTDEFFAFFRKYIEKYKKEIDDETEDNYIKAYLREKRKVEAAGKKMDLTEEDLANNTYMILIAGSESTSTTIVQALLLSIYYPEMQKKIYEEIKEHVGTERVPIIKDRKKLNYLSAFMAETQRFRALLPNLFPRECSKTTQVAGYTIPEGAFVLPILDPVAQDEKLWGDPQVFRPERFLDANGIYSVPEYHIPFFLGKRQCMGESMAMMELILFAARVIQRFEVCPEVPGQMPSIVPDYTIGCGPKPFKARFVERVQQ